jgi:cytoplasmic FMR1 interacting protein
MYSISYNQILNDKNIILKSFPQRDIFEGSGKESQPCSQSIFLETKSTSRTIENDYLSYFSTFPKELEYISNLEAILERGADHIRFLYCYRSVSQAIPETSIDLSNESLADDYRQELSSIKSEIHEKLVDTLRPQMAKIKDIMLYTIEAINTFYTSVSYVAHKIQQKEAVPDHYYLTLIHLFDVLVSLDQVKDSKSSVNKDFIRYKRAVASLSRLDTLEELSPLQEFLANQDIRKARNYIFMSLLESIQRINSYEIVFSDLLEFAILALEGHELCVLPEDKYRFLRVLPYFLIIIDTQNSVNVSAGSTSKLSLSGSSNKNNIYKFFAYQKIKLPLIQKYFQVYPVIPVYGDIYVYLEGVLLQSPSYDRHSLGHAWGYNADTDSSSSLPIEYNLLASWEDMRNEYASIHTRLSAVAHRYSRIGFQKDVEEGSFGGAASVGGPGVTFDMSKEVYMLVLEGVSLLSNWQFRENNMITWKAAQPCSMETILETLSLPTDSTTYDQLPAGIDYARLFKYNLSLQEITTLIDAIFMIKSISSYLLRYETFFAPFIRCYIHHTVQQLVQGDFIPLLHRLDKRNKPILSVLLQIRSIAADWGEAVNDGGEGGNEYKEYSRRQGRASTIVKSHPVRVVAPATTQLIILRMEMESLLAEKSEIRRKNSIFSKSDLEKDDITLFQTFFTQSAYFPLMLHYASAIHEQLQNFSYLWVREFSLELTRSSQFPIEYSLPWICLEHIFNQKFYNNALQCNIYYEKLIYLLDIYNDTAETIFVVYNQQYLYNELEAECNLVIEQVYFFLCEDIYMYYKQVAAQEIMDVSLIRKLQDLKGNEYIRMTHSFLPTLINQKTISVLGRNLNFTAMLIQNLHTKFLLDIDVAIKRFESQDMCNIIELKTMLKLLMTCHEKLSKYLSLDSFDTMLLEVDESFSPVANRGRISMHILNALAKDLFPNFSYNNYSKRYIPSAVQLKPWRYAKSPKASQLQSFYGGTLYFKLFEMQYKMTKHFFGSVHIQTLLSLDSIVAQSNPPNDCQFSGRSNNVKYQVTQLPMILDQLIKNLFDKILDINEYLDALKDGVPPCKPPQALFRCIGAYGYYEGKLRSLLAYDDLKPEVFQNFREIGNTIVFFQEVSNLLERTHLLNTHVVSYLFPRNKSTPPADSLQIRFKQVHEQLAKLPAEMRQVNVNQDAANFIPRLVSQQLETYQETFGAEIKPSSRSLFKHIIASIEEFFYQQNITDEWSPYSSQNHNLKNPHLAPIEIENSKTFAKLWAALLFLFNLNEVESEEETPQDTTNLVVTNSAEFGHGFSIAGCLFIHILRQRTLYELIDYSSQVLSMREYEAAMGEGLLVGAANVEQSLIAETKRFLMDAAKQQLVTKEWLNYFDSINSEKKFNVKNSINETVFHPPKYPLK